MTGRLDAPLWNKPISSIGFSSLVPPREPTSQARRPIHADPRPQSTSDPHCSGSGEDVGRAALRFRGQVGDGRSKATKPSPAEDGQAEIGKGPYDGNQD